MNRKNKMLDHKFFEGVIKDVVEESDGTVSYSIIEGLDDGTALSGFKTLKFSKNLYNRFEPGQAVFGIKDPKCSTGGFIFGGRETPKDNPPLVESLNDFVISNQFGEISVKDPELEGISILQDGCGIKLNSYNEESNQLYFGDNQIFYNSSGFSYSGKAKIVFEENEPEIYLSTNFYNKYGFNLNYFKNSSLGEYGGVETRVPGLISSFKNKPVVYNRSVYNHMPNNWQGYDLEYDKISDISDSVEDSGKRIKSINSKTNFSHNLDLAPNQVGEVIWGNVFDLDGSILDSNYNKLRNYSPITKDGYLTSQELRRRSLAYHFQVSTVSNSNLNYGISDNYVHSINKEGFLYLNVPGTSRTGVIPYENTVTFNNPYSKPRISSSSVEAKSEIVPVVNHLIIDTKFLNIIGEKERYSKDTSLPNPANFRASGESTFERKKGVGFYSLDSHNKNSDGVSRRKVTTHHNMWSACESLFGNLISDLSIPNKDSDDCNLQSGNVYYKTFEVPLRNVTSSATGGSNLPTYMSTVVVSQEKPAIQTGGGVSVCGLTEKEIGHKPLTNDFDYNGGKIKFPSSSSYTPAGNISGNINFQGSVTANIGKDIHDEKSIMLDCAGSMVCWLGKDKNQRSAVIQTDGSVSLNIGGRSGAEFNKGRLDIRVNINDKGTVESASNDEIDKSQKINGDYIISISENGLVIAGMNSAPMIIRNNGDLCLESTKDIRFIAGGSIIKKEGFTEQADSAENQNASTDEVSPFCDISTII